jgi:hypothetical protein
MIVKMRKGIDHDDCFRCPSVRPIAAQARQHIHCSTCPNGLLLINDALDLMTFMHRRHYAVNYYLLCFQFRLFFRVTSFDFICCFMMLDCSYSSCIV